MKHLTITCPCCGMGKVKLAEINPTLFATLELLAKMTVPTRAVALWLLPEAMSAGVAMGQVFQQLTKGLPAGPALPELVAQRAGETLKDKIARQRRQDAVKAADAGQMPLL